MRRFSESPMSVNCTENCGRLRKVERTVASADDMRMTGRGVLRFVAGLASQAAIVIAVLSTSAAAVVRHIIRKRFYTHPPGTVRTGFWSTWSAGNRQADSAARPAQFATTFRQPL